MIQNKYLKNHLQYYGLTSSLVHRAVMVPFYPRLLILSCPTKFLWVKTGVL